MKKIVFYLSVVILVVFCSKSGLVRQVINHLKYNIIGDPNEIVFGIDVSHYQGYIDWDKVSEKHPIEFVIIRSTMGDDRKDRCYKKNMEKARDRGFIVGSYHYYDPNENSTKQAENFCNVAEVRTGDFRPVLDIENISSIQSVTKLRKGLMNWINIVENKYGVKPIIYTGLSFYETHLEGYFDDCPLWIAAYSEHRRDEAKAHTDFIQFTESINVSGIKGPVDGNDMTRGIISSLLY
ncbi:MAG: lysozyme [Candidatus Paceibacteria bacterium]|jgi:lysozyme